MKNFKYLAVAISIAAMTLTGCGGAAETSSASASDGAVDTASEETGSEESGSDSTASEETRDAADSEEADSTAVNTAVAASPDVDTTYPAYDVNAGETAATASASLTVYTNHTVSFTDASGNTMEGFIFVDRYAMGNTTSDMAFLMDSTTNGIKYLTDLVYTDDSSDSVTLAEATAIGYTESDTNSNYETIGNLVLMGSSESLAPGMVYEMFLNQTNLDMGVYSGNCFTYNTVTKECGVAWWEGSFTSDDPDFSGINDITIKDYDNSGNVIGTTDIGKFEKVYAALGNGPVAEDTSLPVTSKTYKALSFDYSSDYIDQTTESVTIFSDGTVKWTDSNGKTWNGFYFKDWYQKVTNNHGLEEFMEFTDGKNSKWFDRISFWAENGNSLDEAAEDQATCIRYSLVTGSGISDDTYEYSHMSEKLCLIDTATAAAPNKIFLIYFNEDYDYASLGNYFGDVVIYDYSTGKYEERQWTAPMDGFDSQNFSTITIWTDDIGGCLEGSSLD